MLRSVNPGGRAPMELLYIYGLGIMNGLLDPTAPALGDTAVNRSSFLLRRVAGKVLGQTAGELLHLQRVGEPRVKQGRLAHGDDLCDTPEPPKFVGIQNPVAVVLGVGPHVCCGHYVRLSRSTGVLAALGAYRGVAPKCR
jgi:hypothetical protein